MADAQEKLAVAGLACLSVGIDKITAFNDGTAAAKFLSEAYEPILESELSLYKWRFATAMYNLKPNLIAESPLSRWNNAYQLPTGVVAVDTVLINDQPIEYERQGQTILTNDTEADDVILQYRFRANETQWYPYFRQLMVHRLATGLAFSVTRQTSVAEKMNDIANDHFKRAKTMDAQSQSNQKLRSGALKRGRGGAITKFWRNR
jgi:hypothetical protein